MPEQIRLAHGFELGISNFVFGLLVAGFMVRGGYGQPDLCVIFCHLVYEFDSRR